MKFQTFKRIILISGAAGHGKDTFAKLNFGAYKRIAIADKAKDAYAKEAGIPRRELDDIATKERHRQGLIDYSVTRRGVYGARVWADECINAIMATNAELIVVPDLRYIGEKEAFAGKFGCILHVHMDCPDVPVFKGDEPIWNEHLRGAADLCYSFPFGKLQKVQLPSQFKDFQF